MVKRIITLCMSLMMTLFSGAQGFEFQYRGQSIADDAVVTIAAAEDAYG